IGPIPEPTQADSPYEFISHDTLRIWLYGRGEYFGFIEATKPSVFTSDDARAAATYIPELVKYIAEENFSFRMHILLEPFAAPGATFEEEPFFASVVDKVLLGFGADGSTLRIYESDQNTLRVRASAGHSSGVVIEPRKLGELVSGKVFNEAQDAFAGIVMHKPDLDTGGVDISDSERKLFIDAGVTSLVVGKLAAPGSEDKSGSFGT
ncbi:hypothetical protein, partial [Rhodoplanes sp. SY1]|uniref:hypothetical protein n=1 Tax=Rhodoplanes sp. SY1 TaxID=3166646 RepID=UPI0038B456B9